MLSDGQKLFARPLSNLKLLDYLEKLKKNAKEKHFTKKIYTVSAPSVLLCPSYKLGVVI